MGGHGGLNILPQKRWNVYNFDNREKVKKDEEAAAKEEQIKREQSRKRDTEFRIQQLRQSRGLPSTSTATAAVNSPEPPQPKEAETEPKSKHINLFEGIRIFDPIDNNNKNDNKKRDSLLTKEYKKMKKEEAKPAVPVSAEDEKYRLGYGLAGKGVKLPWYLMEKQREVTADARRNDSDSAFVSSSEKKKKSVSELREERLKREAREKKRQQALITKTRRL